MYSDSLQTVDLNQLMDFNHNLNHSSLQSEGEQQFLDTLRSPQFHKPNYFTFIKPQEQENQTPPNDNNNNYKDKVIHQLMQKNNHLEDSIADIRKQYELRIRTLETSLETLKEHSGITELPTLKLQNKQLNQQLIEMQQTIEILHQQNRELLKNKEQIKYTLLMELKQLKSIISMSSQQPQNNKLNNVIVNELRQNINKFVQSTADLDEKYYSLLDLVDENILRREMPQLEQLNKQRTQDLDAIYQCIQ